MIREIARVPLFPQRVLELLDELRAVTTALLDSQSHQRHTLDAVNETIGAVASDAAVIPDVLGVLEGIRTDVNRIDERIGRIEAELHRLSDHVDEVVPDDKPGALAKARDALTGG